MLVPHVPEEGILTGTYFARDQVPDCPDFTRAKNKLPSLDKYYKPRHSTLINNSGHLLCLVLSMWWWTRQSAYFCDIGIRRQGIWRRQLSLVDWRKLLIDHFFHAAINH